MSLQVWLPLNGNLENQGLSDAKAINHNTTVNNNGKIGKCYQNTASNYITIPVTINVKQSFSLCYWYRIDTWNSWGTTITLNAANGDYLGMCPHSNGTMIGTNWYETRNGTNTQIFDSYHNNTIIAGQWNHIVITFNGTNNIKTYINGILVSNGTVRTNPLTDFTELTLFRRGRQAVYGYSSLNDVRVYNHALSEKEVKELAKGLILHYRLAGPGQENLTKGNNTYERNSASIDGWFWFSDSNFNCKPSTTYTLSIDVDGTISDFHIGSASTDPAKRWASMWLYLCKTGTSTNAAGGGYDSPILLISTNYNFRKIGPTRYAWTYTTPADARSLSIRGNTYSNGTDAIKVKFWNPKIEEGSIATPWCPRSDESIYTTLGYNNNIEYDCSGYLRNGTQNGNFVWSADSPRYTTSYLKTSNSKPLINIPMVFDLGASIQEITMTCWWKSDSTISTDRKNLISLGANNFIRFGPISSTTEWIYCTGTGAAITIPNCMDMKWHHHVITFKGGVFSVYFDGELKGTQTTSLSAIACSDTTNYIGAYNSNSEIVPGAFSDARIYATALSAEDIAELYHSAVIVDNTGKSYAYEYFEG